MALHTLHDGAEVRIMSALELVRIPIWKGNRTINSDHVQRIKQSVGENVHTLDSMYRIVECAIEDAGGNLTKEMHIIDGQHRAQVIKDHFSQSLCAADFNVLVIVKKVESELEIIHCFNTINCVNPITWSDPNLIVNVYITELEKLFNTKKQMFIRRDSTKRPYLNAEKLREVLLSNSKKLKENQEEALLFAKRVFEWNGKQIREADVLAMGMRKSEGDIMLKSAKAGFMLAFDTKLTWIPLLLK